MTKIFNGLNFMRTSVKLFGVVAGMAALFASCNKQEEIVAPESKTVEMTIVAGSEDTKTVLGNDGAVTWSATGEQLAVMEAATVSGTGTTTAKKTSDDGVTSDEGATMTFKVSLNAKTANSFDYYALYPNSAYVDTPSDFTKGKVELASTQAPTESSFGPSADVLVAKPVTGLNAQPTELNLQFARVIAVGKMTIKNLNTEENVQKVTFTVEGKAVTGKSYINFTNAEGVEYGYSTYGVDNVVLDYSGKTIAANGMTAIFTCWPFALAANETFSVVVETENYTFTKDITLAEGKSLEFNVGRASAFNVNFDGIEGVEKAHPTVYTLVEDAAKIADGAEYLIVYNGEVAMGEFNTNNYYGKVSVSAVNKVINITSEAVNVITLEAGETAGQYYMIDSDGKYLYWSSGNTVNRGDKGATDKYLWTIEKDKITNVGDTERRLQYNTSSPRFACYTGSQKDVTLYVNEASLVPSLSTPTTLMADAEGSTITVAWDAVANAESYDVTCAGQIKNVTETEAKFTDVAVGTYEVSVVAKGTGFKNSKAAVTSVIVGKPTLGKPVIKTVSETANGFYAELEAAVQYAESYAWDLYEGSVADDKLVGTGTNATEKFSIKINETDFFIPEFVPETTYYLVITAKATAYTSSVSDAVSFTTAAEANDGSLEKPFTAAEAITAIDAGGDLTNKYVKGVITEVTEFNSTYGSITYNIESGEKTLMVYSGLDLGKAQFSSKSDLKINDEVLVCGTLKKYNSTYEFVKNNYLVTLNGSSEVYVGLKVSGQTTTFNVEDEFVFGGTVVQDWRGKDDIDVTSSATFSGYDMNNAGTQTVTVTVGEDSTTYEITVKEAGAPGGDPVTYTALFGSSYNSKGVSSYSGSWSATNGDFKVDLVNWNNNNNGWKYIKAGSKNGPYVATITTNAAITEAITKVAITIDAVTTNAINSITLYCGDKADACTTQVGTFTIATGEQSVTISSPTSNKFYKISADCKQSTNGALTVSKVVYTKE